MSLPPISDLLEEGLALHRRGAVRDAAARYVEVLRADPAHVDAHYYLATISCQQGRFDEGADHARKALIGDPRHARAHVLLGRSLSALGQSEPALASFERAIALAPDLAQAHGNRGDVLSDLGRNAEAVESYDRALALAPGSIEDWFNRGVALAAVDRKADAVLSFDRAIAGKPDYTDALLWRAKLLTQLHRHHEALAAVDKAFVFEPRLAHAWLGRGNVLLALGRFDDALAAYDQALKLKPDLGEAWIGCGRAHIGLGKPELAIEAASRALECGETAQTKAFFAQCLGLGRLTADNDGRFRGLALRALAEGWTHPRQLVQACVSLVALDGVISACVARAERAWPARLPAVELFGASGLQALSRDALLHGLLQSTPITDVGFERLLTNIRSVMLTAAETGSACDEGLLGFYCAVARQCYENDYVYSLADDEADRAQRLRVSLEQALAAGSACPPLWPAAVGTYCPLHTLSNAQALLERSWPQCVKTLLVQQVEEPAEERRLATTIPALTEHRQRSVALGAPTIRGKPLSALGQGSASAATHAVCRPTARADFRCPGRRLRHGTCHDRAGAARARGAHPCHRSQPCESRATPSAWPTVSALARSNSRKLISRNRPHSGARSISSTCPACCIILRIHGKAGARYSRCCGRAARCGSASTANWRARTSSRRAH